MIQPISITIAGGGCRTVWGVGVLVELGFDELKVREWSGVSAGAAMAVTCASGRINEGLRAFMTRVRSNPRNVYLEELVTRRRPVFPHQDIYEEAMLETLKDGGFERMQRAAPIRIFLSYVNGQENPYVTIFGAISAYVKRRRLGVVHGPERPHPGLTSEVVTAQEARSPEEIVEWVIASSATPPLTKVPVHQGRRYADGSLVDNIPIRALSPEAQQGKVLALLSRPVPPERFPAQTPRRLYLAPPSSLGIAQWDYAAPVKLKATFEAGKEYARNHRRRITRWLEAPGSPAEDQRV